MKIHERRWIDDGPVARERALVHAAPDSRGSTRSRTPGSARPPRPSSRRASTLATTDAAATDSTVWSALMIVRTVRGIAEVVVLAVEHDAVGLEALRRELARARGPPRGAAPRSCRARRTPSWLACPTPMPRAQPRTRRGRDLAFGGRQQLRVADARRGARRRARPRRP